MFNKFDNKGGGGSFAPRPMVKGNWKCSDCGKDITELPFEPAPDRPIYCKDCWAKNRPPRQNNRY
ncbi:endonuclease Q family protein [Candidatus Parcubacteria bacterium]|nr:endonuclease Q family protein [Candidatus Parcubacteria bacterium]